MPRVSQYQVQKLLQKLSPQQIQLIKLLELPAMQLEQRIRQEIEDNPILEEEQNEEKAEEERVSVEEYFAEDDTPRYKYTTNNSIRSEEGRPFHICDGKSLMESMIEQIGFKPLTERQSTIAKFIVGSLDDDGYLRRDLQSIADDIVFSLQIEVEQEEVEEVLKIVQELEPTGVGARDLRECLLLQLEMIPYHTNAQRIAHRIISSHFDDFTKKHYEKLIARLNIDDEQDFHDAYEVIVGLMPKPGNTYCGDKSDTLPYIIPDFILDNNNDTFELRLNSSSLPDIKVNKRYVEMIRTLITNEGEILHEKDKEAVQFVKNKIDSAKWFISAIKQRQETLLQTMQAIINYQRSYFIDGDLANLKPMILKDIATITGLDVSTISRVVNSKYIQTHFGIISLKQLFSEAIMTDSGEHVSSYQIKYLIDNLIQNEDKSKPITDEVLMEKLNEAGYQIARRTVAKYREMLDIPVARLRRELSK